MPGTRKETMDIREMLRRLRKGQSNRAIAKAMKVDRKTVSRYRIWAREQGLVEGPLPSLSDLQRIVGVALARFLENQCLEFHFVFPLTGNRLRSSLVGPAARSLQGIRGLAKTSRISNWWKVRGKAGLQTMAVSAPLPVPPIATVS